MVAKHGDRFGCPADDCSGGRSDRQHPLTEAQLSRISDAARGKIAKSGDPALRCNYCGCVYLTAGNAKLILGFWDSGVDPNRWVSRDYP